MPYFKVTQLRSAIAMPQKYKDTLFKLGLGKRGKISFRKVNPQQAGMLATVKELVKVELSEENVTQKQLRLQRKSNPGFTLERKD